MVKRPDNDQRANELIRQISRATYDYFFTGGKLPANNNPNPTNSTDFPNPTNSNNPPNNATSPDTGATTVIENIQLPLPNANRNPNTP